MGQEYPFLVEVDASKSNMVPSKQWTSYRLTGFAEDERDARKKAVRTIARRMGIPPEKITLISIQATQIIRQ